MGWFAAFSAPARVTDLPGLRRRLQDRLLAEGLSSALVERAGLVVSELAHNALEHSDRGGRIHATLHAGDGGPVLSVAFYGDRDLLRLLRGLERSRCRPPADAERGRGLWLVRQYGRDLRVESGRDGWVRVSLRLAEEAAEG